MRHRWTSAWLLAAALVVTSLPLIANAAPLPAPVPQSPTAGATVDQPVFSWAPVSGAKSYEIEVALDDQFVTVTDPQTVSGTTYVPTFSYTAKTHYWHVRAVASDSTEGEWSSIRDFTRRWTNDDEPAGTEQDLPASRVENVRSLTGDPRPPLNQLGLTWDPVPGAAYYEVEFSVDESFSTELQEGHVVCLTPHTTLTPYASTGGYDPVPALLKCDVNSPVDIETHLASWLLSEDSSRVTVRGDEDSLAIGDKVVVTYLDDNGQAIGGPARVEVSDLSDDGFTIGTSGKPDGVSQGHLRWYKPELRMQAEDTYYVRVRAVDPPSLDYPRKGVVGIWSDQRQEPDELEPPGPLVIKPSEPVEGPGSLQEPAAPLTPISASTDVPLLEWEPGTLDPETGSVPIYQVVVALDRDFTNRVATYLTRTTFLMPMEVFHDLGGSQRYYWYALPCSSTCVADRKAINHPAYVGRFSKQSAPLTALTQTALDAQANVLLRWGDALTAAQAEDPDSTSGGLTQYQVEFTTSRWAEADSVSTDNLAYSTATESLTPGTYRWRVRPLDGQGVPLAWAYGPDFTIVGSDEPDPTPTQPSPTPPQATTPPPVYEPPAPADGTASGIPPTAPGTPKVTRSGKKKLRVKWRAAEELGEPVSEYLVYRSKDGLQFALAKTTTAVTLRLAAKPGATYWFYVVADSDAGRSEPSPTRRFRMPGQSK